MNLFGFLAKKPAEDLSASIKNELKALKRENAALKKHHELVHDKLKAHELELTKHQMRFANLDIVTETNVEFIADVANETKTHQRHIAGLFKKVAVLETKL